MEGRRGMLLGLRTLANNQPSIQTISSTYGRKVGTYRLLLRRICLVHQPCHSGCWRCHLHYCSYLVWVDLDASFGHHEPQEFPYCYSERTLAKI